MPQRINVRLTAVALLALAMAACTAQNDTGQAEWSFYPGATAAAAASEAPAASSAASAAAPSDAAPSGAAPSGGTGPITIGTDTGTALQFDPNTVTAPGGGTIQITFENRATAPHNLTFDDPINQATESIVNPGDTQTLEFPAPAPGDYKYVCTLHPGMEGTLTVQ